MTAFLLNTALPTHPEIIVFWSCVAAIFYVYVGYPLLLAFITIFCPSKYREPGYTPSISILIAAYNEEASIEQKLQQTLALNYPADKMQILVLSDCSTDHTDEIVRACSDARVSLLRMPIRKGKTCAQNQGVLAATADIIVFSDATTIYHPDALHYLVAHYADPGVGAVSGRYEYFDEHQKSPTASGSIAFWNYENVIKAMQSRIKTITGCCGCIYSVRKSAYTPLPADIISDLVQPLWVIKQGYRVVFEDCALAYEKTTESQAEELAMRVRIITRAIRGILSVPDILNPHRSGWIAFQLWSHKVLRWLVGIFLTGLFLSNLVLMARPWYRAALGLQLLFYSLALLSWMFPLHRLFKPLGIPLYFCVMNYAALKSFVEVYRGRKYVVWETVRR